MIGLESPVGADEEAGLWRDSVVRLESKLADLDLGVDAVWLASKCKRQIVPPKLARVDKKGWRDVVSTGGYLTVQVRCYTWGRIDPDLSQGIVAFMEVLSLEYPTLDRARQ